MAYGDVHRFFLRTIASRGVLSMEESKSIVQNYTGSMDDSDQCIRKLVKEINKEITPFQQRINIVKDKNMQSSEETLIFMMIVSDNATKSQRIFSEKELNYFRTLLEKIVTSEDKEIFAFHALHCTQFQKNEAENLLKRWCDMHYLHKEIGPRNQPTGRGNNTIVTDVICYTLGLRAIYEFETYFRDYFQDFVEKCKQCKEIVFKGLSCTICKAALHVPCSDIHMRNQHHNAMEIQHDVDMENHEDTVENGLDNAVVDLSQDSGTPESPDTPDTPDTDEEIQLLQTDSDSSSSIVYVRPRKRRRVLFEG